MSHRTFVVGVGVTKFAKPGRKDAGRVKALSSSVLSLLLYLRKRVETTQGQLRLCCLAPALKEAFRSSGLERVFKIHDEESAALDSF